MVADGGSEFKGKLKIQRERERERGGLVSESGGQICSCHLISGNDITADFSFSLLLPLCHSSVTGEVELLLARVFTGRGWGAAFNVANNSERVKRSLDPL